MCKSIIYITIFLFFSCTVLVNQPNEKAEELCSYEFRSNLAYDQMKIKLLLFDNLTSNNDSIIFDSPETQITLKKSPCSKVLKSETEPCIKYFREILDKKTGVIEKQVYDHLGQIYSNSYYYENPFSDEIGVYTKYNSEGKVIESLNYEKGYNICIQSAMEIAKSVGKDEIEKYDVTEFSINRVLLDNFPHERPTWFIGFIRNKELELPDEKVCGKLEKKPYFYNTKYCKIDGLTGKVIDFSSRCITIRYDN